MIRIYNTETHEKEDFNTIEHGKVKMYVCGPTVYNYIHVGNARTFVCFDVVRRYLQYRGYKVKFVQNITDVDDKIINQAKKDHTTPEEIAKKYSQAFIDDMHKMNILDPDVRPRATEEIPEMIKLIQALIDNGHAYEAAGDVYFSVRSDPDYGELSHRNIDELESGHRDLVSGDDSEIESRKHDPLDFALWKAAKPGEPAWDSPWGKGRPGWHCECSAMSHKYLGLPIDIHGGGADLVFPHHENEMAQSRCGYGTDFVHYWMHTGMLQINSEKMSKSLGNFLLLRDVLKTTDPDTLRMLILQTHYRNPLDYSKEHLDEAQAAVDRIMNLLVHINFEIDQADNGSAHLDAVEEKNRARLLRIAFVTSMDDDFNTAGALGKIFSYVNDVNTAIGKDVMALPDVGSLKTIRDIILETTDALGFNFKQKLEEQDYPDEVVSLAVKVANYNGSDKHEAVQALLDARENARSEKNYELADQVRDGLAQLGFTIKDMPQGACLSYDGGAKN